MSGKQPNFPHKPVTKTDPKVLEFCWSMKKRGLSDVTIKGRADRLNRLIRDEANLDDPETVETALATSDFKPVTKRTYIDAYKVYTLFGDITWKKPKCPHITKEPFLPQDEEVKQLIGGMSKRLATLLKLLEETGARIGEIALAEWTDIDFKARTIKINHPEKNSNTRTLPLSKNMIAMLKSLKMRPDNHIFNPNTKTLESNFSRKRNILTERLKNPRLRKIHFHTFRHLKGTNEYQRTRDFKHVQYVLGHKRSSSTDRYTHYTQFKEVEYFVKRPQTKEEEDKLILSGFEFVRFDQRHNEPIYKKRK